MIKEVNSLGLISFSKSLSPTTIVVSIFIS
nr:MAG TPA: hypothetical protein [Bacteriophage sp.]DAX15134.1 MAG TPA: hypothetical protein [Bacteriophage sp.]